MELVPGVWHLGPMQSLLSTSHLALVLGLVFALSSACTDDVARPGDAGSDADTAADAATDGVLWADGDVGSTDTTPHAVTPAECGFPALGPAPAGAAFNDHTVTNLGDLSCFFAYANPSVPFDPDAEGSPWTTAFSYKFTVAGFEANSPPVYFYSNDSYKLHDEWYYFRLLNGQTAPGADTAPVTGASFETVAAIYAALANVTPLPLDLVFIGGTATSYAGRLYSPRFYTLAGVGAATPHHIFGLGTILHYPPRADRVLPERIYAFQLEYGEVPTPATLAHYFEILSRALPPEVAGKLRFLARSTPQESLARSLRASGGQWGDRILLFSDLASPSAFEVYHPGIAAGFLRRVGPGDSLADLRPDEIAILSRVPDDIPPVAAIVSDVPQTALAHVALLAEARDTPNAWLSGVYDDGALAELAFNRRPVIVTASDAGVFFKAITLPEYNTWLALKRRSSPVFEPYPSPETAPYTVDLDPGPTRRRDVALIGGKSVGLTSFVPAPDLAIPPSAMALTVRAYAAWIEPLLPWLRLVMAHEDMRDRRIRFALLEGLSTYRQSYAADPGALAYLERWLARSAADAVLAPIVEADGLQKYLQKQAIPFDTFRPVREALVARFVALSPLQGLRFRSSSTVEDIPGFNGAGLYRSNTGFLEPQLQPGAGDRLKSIEAAILNTWSSYWNYYAYNERTDAGVDHFAGRMAVTVHPRFDDPLEAGNLVLTMKCNGYEAGNPCLLAINAQPGELSVTNPGGSLVLPEVIAVRGGENENEEPVLTRVQTSALLQPGEFVVSESEALTMYRLARAHVAKWLVEDNALRPVAERARSLTLDYELKKMSAGWPALANGTVMPARYIWRQARVLDRPERVGGMQDPWLGPTFPVVGSLPTDLNPLLRRLDVARCVRSDFELRLYQVETDDATRPAVAQPWAYKLYFRALGPISGFTLPTQAFWVSHRAFSVEAAGQGRRVTFERSTADLLGLDSVTLVGKVLTLTRGGAVSEGDCATFETRALYLGPSEYLYALTAPAAE